MTPLRRPSPGLGNHSTSIPVAGALRFSGIGISPLVHKQETLSPSHKKKTPGVYRASLRENRKNVQSSFTRMFRQRTCVTLPACTWRAKKPSGIASGDVSV